MKTLRPKFLISIVGPTAVGKTSLSVEIAETYGAEIISADSRQLFRELEIGTAKPTKNELGRVAHHFINSHSIHEEYDVGKYENEVLDLLKVKFKSLDNMVLTGGSGLYCKAVWVGLDEFPEVKKGVREGLMKELSENGMGPLLAELDEKDASYAQTVDRNNHQRVIRALEVIRSSGRPFSSLRTGKVHNRRDFEKVKVGLELPREELYRRIDNRMDNMVERGLFDEVETLLPFIHLNALQTVGYSEIFGYFKGAYDRKEAIRLMKRNSRRYAKRQLTWFKKDKEIVWFSPIDKNEILDYLNVQLNA